MDRNCHGGYVKLLKIIVFFVSGLWLIPAQALSEKFRCMIRDEPATSICIGWHQASGDNPMVYFGPEDWGTNISKYPYKVYPQRSIEAKGMNNHFARLSRLRPNTVYYFVVVDSEGTSKRYSFKTQPDDHNARLSIIAGGDSRNYQAARRSANLMVARLRPDIVLFNGDMTGGDTAREWVEWMEDWQLTIGQDGRIFSTIVTRGNHEFSNTTLVDMFDVRHPDVYYSHTFARGLLHVISLNSMMSTNGPQREWLAADLQANQDVCFNIAQYHHPVRPHTKIKGEHEYLRRYWVPLFEQYRLQLALESDTHLAKVTQPIRSSNEKGNDEGFIADPNGVTYIGEGGWGAPLRKPDDGKSWTRGLESFNHQMWIFVDLNGMEVRIVKTDNAKEVEQLSDATRFNTRARNLDIWEFEPGAEVVYFQPRHKRFVPRKAQQMLEITQLKTQDQGQGILVEWQTAFELPKVRYKIQFSTNRIHWKTLALMHGSTEDGGTSGKLNYRYLDKSPKHGGKAFYQIIAIDDQGMELARRQIEIRHLSNEELPTLTTYVGSGQITVPIKTSEATTVMVEVKDKNLRRQFLQHQNVGKGATELPISLKHLPEGTYLLEISYEGELLRRNVKIERRHAN